MALVKTSVSGGKGNINKAAFSDDEKEILRSYFCGTKDFRIGHLGLKGDVFEQLEEGLLTSGNLNSILSKLGLPMGGSYESRCMRVSAELE